LESSIKVYNTPNNNHNSYISKIQKSIALQKKISIEYFSPYSEESTNRIVNPIGLYFYSNAWHLIAFCNLRKDYRDFKVDRIKKIITSETSFLIKNHSSLDEYIKMIKNKFELILVKVKFNNNVAKLIVEQKHYYGFVEEVRNESETEMTFMVSSLDLMSRWLISFGKDVEVLSPKKLEVNIKKLIKELSIHYK